jgi:hypothetical protein
MNGKQIVKDMRARLKDRKSRFSRIVRVVNTVALLGTIVVVGLGALLLQFDNYTRAKGISGYDRTQMIRLLDDVNR